MTDVIIPRHYHAPWQDEFCEVCLNEGVRIGSGKTAQRFVKMLNDLEEIKDAVNFKIIEAEFKFRFESLLAGKERDGFIREDEHPDSKGANPLELQNVSTETSKVTQCIFCDEVLPTISEAEKHLKVVHSVYHAGEANKVTGTDYESDLSSKNECEHASDPDLCVCLTPKQSVALTRATLRQFAERVEAKVSDEQIGR